MSVAIALRQQLAQMREWTARDALFAFATVLGPAALFWFAWMLWRTGEGQNIATFGLWGSLDFFFCYAMYKAASKKESIIAGAYGVAAVMAVIMLFRNNKSSIGIEEIMCAVGVAVSMFIRHKVGNQAGIVAATVAMMIAGVPIMHEAWIHPISWTIGLWGTCALSSTTLFLLAPSWKLTRPSDWLFIGSSAAFNLIMAFLVLQ